MISITKSFSKKQSINRSKYVANMNKNKLKLGYKIKDVIKDGRITWNEIHDIRNWIEEKHINRLEDEQIVNMLIACNRDIDLTKDMIKEYFRMKNSLPHLFTNRNVHLPQFQEQLNVAEYCMFPQRTKEGYMIMFHKLKITTYNKYNLELSIKIVLMMLEAATFCTPSNGLIAIADMQGVTTMHLTRIRVNLLKQFFGYLQTCLPILVKGIHVFNCVPWIDKLLAMIKPFVNKDLLSMIELHSSDMNFEQFYQQYIPKKCLPRDYGGFLPSTHELHLENVQLLASMTNYFAAEEKQRNKKT